MKFGVSLTFSVALGAPLLEQGPYAERLARTAEESGLDSIWFADRTVYPADLVARYPDRWGPGRSDPRGQDVLEPVTALSFVAGMTKTLKLGFSILVLPLRHPVLNAKMITTLDVLSGGRVIFGAGVGWMPEEFEGMEADFKTRGSVTDEHIEMFKALCTEEVLEYTGRHFQISGKTFFPRPVQSPHPPVWIGGNSSAALRRAVRLGDGWFPIGLTPEELAAARHRLRRLCEEEGRDPDAVLLALSLPLHLGRPQRGADGGRRPLTGELSDIVDDVARYRDAGLEYLVFSVPSEDRAYTVEAIKRFAEEVVNP
ncbi:MAG: LLM class F420-dependent oxidoreductase [Chloroflexi bacterium]|nr:LLM class F420-dependent oxidoreductase [Chloroflexota bacterium]